MKHLKPTATLLAKTTADSNKIHGIANSLTTSRDGTLIAQEAAKAAIGQTVPLLPDHDWGAMPIGSATMTDVTEDGLSFDGVLFDSAPARDQILEGINAGVLSVSVGFIVNSYDDKTNAVQALDLLELSVTAVPADSHASITQHLHFENVEVQEMAQEDKQEEQAPEATEQAAATLDDIIAEINAIGDKVQAIADKVAPADEPDDSSNAPADEPDTNAQSLDNGTHDVVQSVKGDVMAQFMAKNATNMKEEN